MEHPFYGSGVISRWVTFPLTDSVTADLMFLIDCLPARDRRDSGLGAFPYNRQTASAGATGPTFMSTPTPVQGSHPEWDTFIFNYAQRSAEFSAEQRLFGCYHADGLGWMPWL
jgi:1,4-alpha-glucan branching enzyme